MHSNNNITNGSLLLQNYLSGSPLTGKKIAPEPPRRHCSIRNSRTLSGEGVPSGSVAQAHQQAAQQQQQAQHMFYGHTAQHWQDKNKVYYLKNYYLNVTF